MLEFHGFHGIPWIPWNSMESMEFHEQYCCNSTVQYRPVDYRTGGRPPVVSLVIPGFPASHSWIPGFRRLTRESVFQPIFS